MRALAVFLNPLLVNVRGQSPVAVPQSIRIKVDVVGLTVFALGIDPIVGGGAVRLVKLSGGGVVPFLHAQSVIAPIVGHVLLSVHAFYGTLVRPVIPLLHGRHQFLMLLEAHIHSLPKRLAIRNDLTNRVGGLLCRELPPSL